MDFVPGYKREEKRGLAIMNAKYGTYLIIPLKYDEEQAEHEKIREYYAPFSVDTMDLNETVKRMFAGTTEACICTPYRVTRDSILSAFQYEQNYRGCEVHKDDLSYVFDFLDSYLYVFHTRVAFFCLGLSFAEMEALECICNPGYAQNEAVFQWCSQQGERHVFSMDALVRNLCAGCGLAGFYGEAVPMLLEAYTYILALTDTMFVSLEELQRITFNLHQMQDFQVPIEDQSEGDIRYVYAVKNPVANRYRWGACVTSQTIAYAVADPNEKTELREEMETQAADGLPIVLLALYEKYTCQRFAELISDTKALNLRSITKLKKMMLRFQAFGTVTPANLSRWNNVRQIYEYLLDVCDINTAIRDISTKLEILVEEQQELENQRSTRILNLITIFGVVGIMSSVQSIVQILSDGSNLMWSVTVLTTAIIALCFGLAMKK